MAAKGTEMTNKEIINRRRRAREVALGVWKETVSPRTAIAAAIETATRVQITPEIAAAANAPAPMHDSGTVRARAVLEAAGFEVEP
jgi:hypothetical protein